MNPADPTSSRPGADPGRPALPEPARQALQRIYQALGTDVAAAGPVCELSGRCCRFLEFDHTLYLTEPEADWLLDQAPAPVRPLDDGATCPWQDDRGHCTAREARPLGCRVYYCDPSYQQRASELSEQYLGELKVLAATYDLNWNYAPLHWHLRRAQAAGRFPGPPTGDSPPTAGT